MFSGLLARVGRALPRSSLRAAAVQRKPLCSSSEALAAKFSALTDLADEGLGAKVLFATDEWFAVAGNLLKPSEAHWDPNTFDHFGKVMDGWESRRRRLPGHDWTLIRLGLSGHVHGVVLDTAHFTGNQAPAARVLAACIEGEDDSEWLGPPRATLGQQGSCASPEEIAAARARVEAAAEWIELVPISKLRPGYTAEENSVHRFEVPPGAASRRVTHLLLDAHPDGGIARMRAWGVVSRVSRRTGAPTHDWHAWSPPPSPPISCTMLGILCPRAHPRLCHWLAHTWDQTLPSPLLSPPFSSPSPVPG